MTTTHNPTTLLNLRQHLTPHNKTDYIQHTFKVPENAVKVGLSLKYYNEFSENNPRKEVMFVSLHDPNGFRGHRMFPGGRGEVTLTLWVSPDDSSEGGVPGLLPAGEWIAQIDIRVLTGETDYELLVYAQTGKPQPPLNQEYPADHIVNPNPGWYKGELHAHSTESDGKFTVEQVVQAAINYGLDFFSLTDHTTSSQWHKLAKLVNQKTALIRSLEITSHIGHANLHGLQSWVNVYIDRPGWDVNQAIEAVHQQGGLFCINHAYSGDLSWRDFSLDWSKVDLEEIYHNLEGSNNDYQLSLWDHHLLSGYRIVGVGGIDSHKPFEGLHELGQVNTVVYADELSESGIIQGLKRGQVYVSRGPQIRFQGISHSGETAQMWESLPITGGPFQFEVKVLWDKPLRIFVMRDAMMYKIEKLDGSPDWQTVNFTVNDQHQAGYYRIELHDITSVPPYSGLFWRNFSTMRILTNPIWIK